MPELDRTEDADPDENEEKEQIGELFKNGLKCDVSKQKISRAFRLGRPRLPNDKPRPLKVFLQDTASKQTILEKRKSLSKLPPANAYRKVFIRPDWTKLQRDIDYERRQSSKNTENTESHDIGRNPHNGTTLENRNNRRESRDTQPR